MARRSELAVKGPAMRAVVLAGGKGARLAPYTSILPKPLMPVGSMPILEVVLRQLQHHGFTHVTLAVGHLSQLIMAYFNNGPKLNLRLDYSQEGEPLGTAGPLALVPNLNSTFLVMNGDTLTTIDYSAMAMFHRAHNAAATIAAHERNVRIDFGLVEVNEKQELVRYIEKPTMHYSVSMGVYVLEPRVLKFITPCHPMDLPELMRALMEAGERVICYQHPGYWMDIGRPDDYQQAVEDFDRMQADFLGESA